MDTQKKSRKRIQTIKVKDYGYDCINRLAVVLASMEKMDATERGATLRYLKSKYSADWPSDNY